MVLEHMTSVSLAERKPFLLFLIGLLIASVSVLFGTLSFQSHASLVMVFLTVIAVFPLVYSILKYESKKSLQITDVGALFFDHSRAFIALTYLFLGVTVSYVLWYVFLPSSSTALLFHIQTETINAINGHITGFTSSVDTLFRIFFNNFKVMLFSIIFSLLYGVGFMFIIVWNSSVIAAAIGNLLRSTLSTVSEQAGQLTLAHYFSIITYSFARYFTHGVLEIAAYIVAGVAGGLLSIAFMKKSFESDSFNTSLLDVSDLILVSIVLLFAAALTEVYISHVFF